MLGVLEGLEKGVPAKQIAILGCGKLSVGGGSGGSRAQRVCNVPL